MHFGALEHISKQFSMTSKYRIFDEFLRFYWKRSVSTNSRKKNTYDTETSDTESFSRRDEIESDVEDTTRERVCPVGREKKSCIFFSIFDFGHFSSVELLKSQGDRKSHFQYGTSPIWDTLTRDYLGTKINGKIQTTSLFSSVSRGPRPQKKHFFYPDLSLRHNDDVDEHLATRRGHITLWDIRCVYTP